MAYIYAFNDSILNGDPLGLIGVGRTPGEITKQRIEKAIETLRNELCSQPCPRCAKYFASQPNAKLQNLCSWVQSNAEPYIQVLPRRKGQRGFGAAEQNEQFINIYIWEDSLQNSELRMPCDLASLILHESGHLARKDTSDNEPQDFFDACKIGCLIPGKYH